MLSKKMTFSLTSLVVCLMFAFIASYALADHPHTDDFDIQLRLDEDILDVSSDSGSQVYSGRIRAVPYAEPVSVGIPQTADAGNVYGPALVFLVESAKVIQMIDDVDLVRPSGKALGLDDITVHAFDDLGRSLGSILLSTLLDEDEVPNPTLAPDPATNTSWDYNSDGDTTDENIIPIARIEHKTPGLTQLADPGELPGRQFQVTVFHYALRNAYPMLGGAFEIHTLLFTLKPGAAEVASLSALSAFNALSAADQIAHPLGETQGPRTLRVDLVGADEGNPRYRDSMGALVTPVADPAIATRDDWADDSSVTSRMDPGGYPNVVSITKLTGTSRDITIRETGPFDIKIVLTEEPHADYTGDNGTKLVEVTNGKATAITKGLTFGSAGEGPRSANDATDTYRNFTAVAADVQEQSMSPNPAEGGYDMLGTGGMNSAFDGAAAPSAGADPIPEPTGRDNRYHSYRVTITPNVNLSASNVIVTVKRFRDKTLPIAKEYLPIPRQEIASTRLNQMVRNTRLKNGREILTVPVQTGEHPDRADLMAAWKERRDREDDPRSGSFDQSPFVREIVGGDHRDLGGFDKFIIPEGGYLVLASGTAAQSGIANSPRSINRKLTEEQEKYNVVYGFTLPSPANDLEAFFRNGGTLNLLYSDLPLSTTAVNEDGDQIIGPSHTKGDAGSKVADTAHKDYTGYDGADSKVYTKGSLVISEVMWGLDRIATTSQYIELYNPGTEPIELDPLEWVIVVGSVPSNLSAFTVIDTIGNTPSGVHWPVPGKSGETGAIIGAELQEGQVANLDDIPVIARGDLVSMSRVMDGAALAANGTAQKSWSDSKRPSINLAGRRIGTPGAANVYDTSAQEAADAAAADAAAKAAADAAASKASPATAGDLMITEIMVASNSGRLPQWIEITNTSVGEVSLDGWRLGIDNDDSADSNAVLTSLSIKLDGVTLGAGQSALVVSKTSNRNSGVAARSKGDDNAGALDSNRIVDASSQIRPASMTYSMLSEMSFRIALEPPLPIDSAATVRGKVVGNLGRGWELPMSEDGRSSIIRRKMGKTGEIMGTDAAGWTLASSTGLGGAYVGTYYGDKDDVGTPGYDAGGALPVELSKFGAKRDPLTGQVIVSWETQSELNNAGFFIKRSQQKHAKFVAVNPTMIPGAGTTSEKQSYTYTDTTAQPNIVYYYQIEDVSLDGQRQTLTRAHRLKGHVGAAGKLTTLWGELKDRE